MSDKKTALRNRGRPKGSGDLQRQRLLRAAEELLDGTGYDLSLRQVAALAGVTPPLTHYYFKSRDGLFEALVDERARPHIDELLTSTRERAAQPVAALTRLMQRLTLLIASDPFIGRCLLLPAGRALRAELRTDLAALLQTAQAAGQLRADLSSGFLAEALLGLCLFPSLDGTSDAGAEQAAALTLQHVALLQDGILPRVRA